MAADHRLPAASCQAPTGMPDAGWARQGAPGMYRDTGSSTPEVTLFDLGPRVIVVCIGSGDEAPLPFVGPCRLLWVQCHRMPTIPTCGTGRETRMTFSRGVSRGGSYWWASLWWDLFSFWSSVSSSDLLRPQGRPGISAAQPSVVRQSSRVPSHTDGSGRRACRRPRPNSSDPCEWPRRNRGRNPR